MNDKTTHFGYQTVDVGDKEKLVRGVFDSVANKYDVMNDVMSGGLHRIWKKIAIEYSQVRDGQKVLDIAGGTGDMSHLFKKAVGKDGVVVHTDINYQMLSTGRNKLIDLNVNLPTAQCNAEFLPFANNTFDCVCVAFGLRNMTNKENALTEMLRVLRPSGRLIVLEFSHVNPLLKPIYDAYSFNLLPLMGKLITQDEESYRYLAESIRMHPDQETLKQMMLKVGFDKVDYHNMTAGVVAIHRGFKY